MKVFVFHHTQDLQDYNEHEVFATLDDARKKFSEIINIIHRDENITEVYNDQEDEFYFETKYGSQKLYITEHEIK